MPATTRLGLLLALLAGIAPAAEEAGKILRPVEGAALPAGPVDIVATAPGGRLELDGKPLAAEEPFPKVFHAVAPAASGSHTLALVWPDGRQEVHFFMGDHPPPGFQPFHQHPPLADVKCTQCHEMSRRGRFRFKGGCFDCHQQEGFAKVHSHDAGVLAQCGLCHNAHGSTVKGHLLYPKQTACKLCHN